MARTFKLGEYRITIGAPQLTGIPWILNVERWTLTAFDVGRPIYESKVIFRLQYDDGSCVLANYNKGWRRVV